MDIASSALANFLRVTYALLLIRHGGFLFHSAGMIRNGCGYLFYGHSGSGKTTVSRLSQNHVTLLSDDLVAGPPPAGAKSGSYSVDGHVMSLGVARVST